MAKLVWCGLGMTMLALGANWLRSSMRRCSPSRSARPAMAVMAIGTSWARSARLRAVTTISSTLADPASPASLSLPAAHARLEDRLVVASNTPSAAQAPTRPTPTPRPPDRSNIVNSAAWKIYVTAPYRY